MDIEHICFIAEGYPTVDDPYFTFFKQLVCAIADKGVKCSVIVPQSISHFVVRSERKQPFHWIDTGKKGSTIDIYQPRHISFSNFRIFGIGISHFFWRRAVVNAFDRLKIKPCVIYGHFWHCSMVAAIIGKKYKLPVFVSSGECKISVCQLYSNKTILRYLATVSGVICVSTKNMEESMELNLASRDKMIVIPNAINNELFYFENKSEVREKLGFDKNDFIVAFTGWFDSRKGVLRLSEAINRVGNVKSIYIGFGEQQPKGDGILFCGKLSHEQIVHYLNAADVFVLPTLAEGCCNAIIEAMACGLPIISSDLPFNDDILNEQNSIRVDSNNIDEIADAIRFLRDNQSQRENMSKAALESAKELEINARAQKVMQFIKTKSGEN